MKGKLKKSLILASLMFSIAFVGLAFVPHHACACGQYEDGSQLTYFVNSVSEKLIGRKIIETNPKPSL
jgi:hypothetical protein